MTTDATRTAAMRTDAGHTDRDGGLLLQWTGMLLAPATFFAHLQVGYALVPWSCYRQNILWLHVAGALSVLLALAGAWAARLAWTRGGGGDPGERFGAGPRARFLGVVGLVVSLVIALILAAQWATAFVISPCQS